MPLTDEQLSERRLYIGGTDAAALAGVNPRAWAQPISVYLEKTGATEPRPSSATMHLGQLLEDAIAELAKEATGMAWRRWTNTIRNKAYPYSGGHVDRIAQYMPHTGPMYPGLEHALLECKWTSRADEWGPSWTTAGPPDEVRVPLRYAVQVQHYLALTGRPRAVLAVLLGYGEFRWYVIERNADLIGWLMPMEEAFWREHVIPRVPPDPDGSSAYTEYIRERYASSDGAERIATPEQALMAEELREVRRTMHRLTEREASVVQRLQVSLGDTERLVGPEFTITWRQGKDRRIVKWEALARHLAGGQNIDILADAVDAVTQKPGTRPFLAKFKDQDYFEGDEA